MRILFLLTYVCFTLNSYGQSKDNWTVLSMVIKESKFDEMIGMDVVKAVPMSPALDLNGQNIEISGYMISLSAKNEPQSHFMFSRYPQNMCFFCGAAGPESAMQVFMTAGEKLKHRKEKVKLKGILQVQSHDASGLIYFLQEAELIE